MRRDSDSFLDNLLWSLATVAMELMTILTALLIAVAVKEIISSRQIRNVTLYDNSGQIVGQWMGDFSVTHNGDTTKIKNSERVIEITGGIVIAEGK